MAKKQKQETFYTYLREDAASLLLALFAIVMIARPADAGFFDWLNNLFSGPNAPIEQAQMVNAQTSTQSCYGKYPEKTSCESAGCTWYQNHYDGTHCDDTAHGQAATTSSSKPLCADGIDNDGDGKIDYPNDDGCYGPDDWSEDIPTATGTGTGIGAPANTTGTPSCSSTPSLCASQAECTAYNFSWSKTTNSCYSNASMCTGDCVGPRSATSPTTPPATTATPPPATATTPPATTATQGTGSTTFSGDANTCPGFSYSKWDTSGKRYCQLNNEEKCDANYPSYMDQANYKKENCPAQTHRQHTWQFSDGTAMSSIINRTDSEFTVYIADIEKQCRTISKNNFTWKPRSGDGSSDNWKEFGIPDCTKGTIATTPTVTTPTTTSDADAARRAEEQRRLEEERQRENERQKAENKQHEEERARKENEEKMRREQEEKKRVENDQQKITEQKQQPPIEEIREMERPQVFVDKRWVQDTLRQIRDQGKELKRLLKQAKKLAGAESLVAAMQTLAAELDEHTKKIKSTKGEDLQEAVQEFHDAQYGDTINGFRAKIELPKQLKQQEREITRTEKILKQKATKRLKEFGLDLNKIQSDLDSMKATIAKVRELINTGSAEDAQEAMQELWSGDSVHPGEIQGVLQQMREMTNALRRIKQKDIRDIVLEIFEPVIEAVNDGDYREANQLLNELRSEMQKIFAQLYRFRGRTLNASLQKKLDALESRIQEKL